MEQKKQSKQDICIPIKDKLNLTIQEASKYSEIGETTIRKLLHERGCPFLLKIGNKHLVKRREFETFLENAHYL
ncbi:MAG: helix-turn-helix domain-containing protein [Agathobacter sp.]|nr:helix-turn-helix domain-containing protein [Agathobacter sp.]